MTAHTRPLREKLYNEMKARIKEKDESVPYKDGEYYYYTCFEEGAITRSIVARKDPWKQQKRLLPMAMN